MDKKEQRRRAALAVGAIDDLLRVSPDAVPKEHYVAVAQAAGLLASFAFSTLQEDL